MRIESLNIRRYRAFDKEVEVPIGGLTVLTGPNNLGKSTVLSALDLLFSAIQRHSLGARSARYSYENDYPKRYLGKSGRRWPTEIRARIALSADDIAAAAPHVQGEIPEVLSIAVSYKWAENVGIYRPSIEFAGIDAEHKQNLQIWLSNNLRYVYIPAARNVQDFRRGTFSELIAGAVTRVSRSRQRLQALQTLYDDVRSELSDVEKELANELKNYIPSVKKVNISIGELDLDRLVSVREIEVDDGVPTGLQQKGDGFKSLFAISVLQYMARQRYGRNLIFGIEEPEAHLHSSAIYEIKTTLRTLAKSFQVLITTHSPIFIERDNIGSNVIVESAGVDDFASVTRVAKNLADIRRSLGIKPHENMTTAEVVVVVEGLAEERTLPRILGRLEPNVAEALTAGRARVMSAGGAANIPAVVRALARDATSCIVLVDSDPEGLQAATRVRDSGLLQSTDVFRVPQREGCNETEYEDLLDPSIYLPAVAAGIGLELSLEQFRQYQQRSGRRGNRCAKWSDVMAAAANAQGLEWDNVADQAKTAFASAVAQSAEAIPEDELEWARSITRRIATFLAEDAAL